MAYANPSTFVSGAVLTAAQQNVLAANDRFFHGPPTVQVSAPAGSSMASVAGTTWNEVSFTVEDWDTDTMWSSTAPTKVFCRTAGKFFVSGGGGFIESSTAGDARGIGIRFNSTAGLPLKGLNTAFEGDFLTGAPMRVPMNASGLLAMTTGQFVQLVFFQNTGVSMKLSTDYRQPVLSMLWVSS